MWFSLTGRTTMQEAIQKAASLIEALGYIQAFQDKLVVVKIGGAMMDDPTSVRSVLTDVVFMSTVGMRPLVIHGGGKAISAAMDEAGIEPRFVMGRRYTDQRTLSIAEHVLCNDINRSLVSQIGGLGGKAVGLHSLSSCVLFGRRMYLPGDEGRRIDIGLVGKIAGVNSLLLETLCASGTIPVIAPIALDQQGGKLNINADDVAGEVAASLHAEKLVVVSDTHGIYTDPKDPTSLVRSLNRAEIQDLIDRGVIGAGMLPKVQSCLRALDGGVRKAHIVDGHISHAPLLEIYTVQGVGTQIINEGPALTVE